MKYEKRSSLQKKPPGHYHYDLKLFCRRFHFFDILFSFIESFKYDTADKACQHTARCGDHQRKSDLCRRIECKRRQHTRNRRRRPWSIIDDSQHSSCNSRHAPAKEVRGVDRDRMRRNDIGLCQRLHHNCDHIAVVSEVKSFKDHAVGKRSAEAGDRCDPHRKACHTQHRRKSH